jgi:hypothetical protein
MVRPFLGIERVATSLKRGGICVFRNSVSDSRRVDEASAPSVILG